MPRDGSGIFTAPFPDVVTATTIESSVHNGTVSDFVTDANAARPIVAGGTGANNKLSARGNLGAEATMQPVTNYDTMVWEAGSFYSAPGATAAPNAIHAFIGTAFGTSAIAGGVIILEASDVNTTPPTVYQRIYNGTTWGAWRLLGNITTVSDGEGIAAVTGDMWYGVRGTAPTSRFVVNSKFDLSGSDWLSVTKAGKVGIGTTGPSHELTVEGAGTSNALAATINITAATSAAQVLLRESGTTKALFDYLGSSFGSGMSGTTRVGSVTATPVQIITGGVARVNIDGSSGDIIGLSRLRLARAGIGVTEPGAAGYSLSVVAMPPETGMGFRPNTNVTYNAVIFENMAASVCGSITTSGTNTAYTTTSDARLKEDLKSFDAGNIVDDTNVYNFAWKADGTRSYGVVAQEAVEIYPNAVTYSEKEDFWGVDYSKYVPVILQELKALRARVALLEGQIAAKPA